MIVRIFVKSEPEVVVWTGVECVPRVGDFIQRGNTPEKLVVESVTWIHFGDTVEILTDRID